jgi:hypothetical protein
MERFQPFGQIPERVFQHRDIERIPDRKSR